MEPTFPTGQRDNTTDDLVETEGAVELSLQLSHPNCWMTQVTTQTPAELLVTAVIPSPEFVKSHILAFAESTTALEELVSETRAADTTRTVSELDGRPVRNGRWSPNKKNTQGLLVESDSAYSIYEAFVSRDFVPRDSIRVHAGTEYWNVVTEDSRQDIQRKLEAIRRTHKADITVHCIKSNAGRKQSGFDAARLSAKQREAFNLARECGYYDWPRKVSGSELAEKLDISKQTLFEHLGKAESKLLNPE